MEQKPLKKRASSILRWIGWVLLVQFVLINISASLYAYKLTHFYNDPPDDNSSSNVFTKSWKLFTGPRYAKSAITDVPAFQYDTISLQTKKGIRIDTWFGRTDSLPKGSVILFHGLTVSRSSLIDEANEFRYEGYNIMMVDFRAHGNSGGNTTTIGSRESEEVKLAFDYLQTKGEKNIFLYGSSMGAVAICKAVSQYQLKPAGVILDMPFQSLQGYLKGKARILGFPKQPFAFLTTFWISVERGFNGFQHTTTRYAQNIHCPVLFQWGSLDNLVLRDDINNIYEAIASTKKKLVIYEGAQHESFLRKDPLKWRIEVERFLAMNGTNH